MSGVRWWLDGEPLASAEPLYRAWSYGDGVFRTLLRYSSQIIDCEGQLQHFQADAAALGLAAPAAPRLEAWLQRAAGPERDCCLKLSCVRAGRRRGYRPEGDGCHVLVERAPAPVFETRAYRDGVVLDLAPVRAQWFDAGRGAKHLNRLDNVLASADWPSAVDERLLLDRDGQLVGGTRSNLFWVSSGHVHTPDIGHSGVRGRLRERVLEACRELGRTSHAVSVGVEALDTADEVFVTNSLIGIWPVARFGSRSWPAPGPVTRELTARIAHPGAL